MALFTPDLTPNPAFYYNTSITASIAEDDAAGDASQINDLSGNGRHLIQRDNDIQPQTGATTWNDQNIVTNLVVGHNAYMEADITGLNNTFTITFVGNAIAGTQPDASLFSMINRFLLESADIPILKLRVDGSAARRDVLTDNIGGPDISSGSAYTDVPTIITVEANSIAGTVSLWVNGTLIDSSSSYNGELDPSLFRLFIPDKEYKGLNSEFGGAICYPYISADLRQRNEGYWAHLYDLLSTLDAAHAYKVTAPNDVSIPNPDAIFITEPPYNMVYSRVNGTTSANVPVFYTYTGSDPTAVQARVVNQDTRAEIVAWQTIDASPSGGGGNGTLSVPQITNGIAYAFEVRTTDAPSAVSLGITKFYVGIWFWIYGQSGARNLDQTGPATETIQLGHTFFDGASFTQPTGAGSIKLGNDILDLTGLPSGHVNLSPGGTLISAIDNVGDTTFYDAAVAHVVASGQIPEFILLNIVHGNSVAPTDQTEYFDILEQLHLDMAAEVGLTISQCPMMICTLTTYDSGSYNEYGWAYMNQTVQYCADQLPNVYLLNIVDAELIPDNGHNSTAGNATIGERAAYQYAQLTNAVEWKITNAQTVYTTTVDITIAFGTGTAFSPTSAITGFEVSNDNFTTPVAAIGAMLNTTTIRLTFSPLSGSLKVRHLYGLNPDISNIVYDNSAVPMPLNQLFEMDAGEGLPMDNEFKNVANQLLAGVNFTTAGPSGGPLIVGDVAYVTTTANDSTPVTPLERTKASRITITSFTLLAFDFSTEFNSQFISLI